MTHLELHAIGTGFTGAIDHFNGTLEATVVVIANFSDDKGTSGPNVEVTYFKCHGISSS
jgi:hypothetical protein